MKKRVILSALLLAATHHLSAQDSGKITFQQTVKFKIPAVEGMDSAMMANLPTESTVQKELIFTKDMAVYHNAPQQEKSEDLMDESSPRVVIKMGAQNDITWSDFNARKQVEQRDFMDRTFLIEKDFGKKPWKLTGNQKTILDYNCQEAVISDSAQATHIWFTPQIPTPAGPGVFSGFPGLVLRVELNNGDFVLSAVDFNKEVVDPAVITKPTEGKKISEEKFKAMESEKMREMQEQYGGEGNTVIRVIRN